MSRRTIQSPGVEIREIDMTQRPAAPTGTNVFIAGFSNQGPVDEIFNVGTFSDFEEIYGKPTNAAERYFYHSTKQAFQSDANILVSRLPYGAGDATLVDQYSALVYPVRGVATSRISSIVAGGTQVQMITGNDTSFATEGNWSAGNINTTLTGNYDSGDADHTTTLRISAGATSLAHAELGLDKLVGGAISTSITYKITFDYKWIFKTDAAAARDGAVVMGGVSALNAMVGIGGAGALWRTYEAEITPTSSSGNIEIFANVYGGTGLAAAGLNDEILIDNIQLVDITSAPATKVTVIAGKGATAIGTGVNNNAPFIAEIVSKDANNNIKYTSVSAQADYPSSGGVVSIDSTSVQTTLNNIANDTILASAVVSAGDTSVATGGTNTGTTASSGPGDAGGYDYFIVGNPFHVELTRSEYIGLAEENITWEDTTALSDYTTPAHIASSGIVVLNKAKLSINNSFEGHYVGLTDNSNLSPASDYDTIKTIRTITSVGHKNASEYATVPTSRYSFPLSSVSTSDKDSTSRTLENVSKFDLDGGQFIDTISLGLFKVRITPFANTDLELTNFLAEGYAGSLNSYRKIQNENGGERNSFFLEDLDNKSPNIKILINPKISKDLGDWTSTDGDAPTKFVRATGTNTNAAIAAKVIPDASVAEATMYSQTAGLYSIGVYADVNTNSDSKNIGSVPDKLDRVFNIASNVDLFDIDVSVEAGLGTVWAVGKNQALSAYDDTKYVDVDGSGTGFYQTSDNMTGAAQIAIRDDYRTIFNKFESFAAQTRKDHIFIADVLRPLVVQGNNGKVLDDKDKNFSKHVYWPLRHQFGVANSNYATTYGTWAKVGDGASGKQVWIPFSGVAAKIYARNDASYAPWYAPAGFNRGVVTGVNDIAVSPTQRQRDQLYRIAINPVTQFPGEGIVIFGQKTLQRKPTAFDRINVRRLFLDLEKRTRETLKFFIFEPNTFLTRTKVVNTLTPMFENCKQTEGVYDYLIVCDDRNNPNSVIEQNELRVDIYLKPVRAAEFILVNFYAVNNDVNFQEIVGQ